MVTYRSSAKVSHSTLDYQLMTTRHQSSPYYEKVLNTNTSPLCLKMQSLWAIIFQCQGSVFFAVLPYCLLNCSLLAIVLFLAKNGVDIAFSPTGHELMTLIISFLVISKVNLGYERYMTARDAIGNALSSLRELNQLVITYVGQDGSTAANQWRMEVRAY